MNDHIGQLLCMIIPFSLPVPVMRMCRDVLVRINSILVHIVLAETYWCSSLFSVKALS